MYASLLALILPTTITVATTTATTAATAATESATTTTAATTAATESATTTARAGFLRLRFIHRQRTTLHFVSIKAFNSVLRLVVVAHFDKTKTPRAASKFICDDIYGRDCTDLTEKRLELCGGRIKGQISYEQLH
jgi:hypothetical protein